jgi:acetoacetyl-CoA synthetase
MMWNFLVGGLLADSAIVLYDGQADPAGLWEFAAEAGVTCFGTSAGFIGACMKAGVSPPELPGLRSVGSTGSPLPVEGFEWVYSQLGDVWLFSTSGGTDLCTAFVGACPLLPVRAGELQARALGAAVEAWDPDGRSLVGEVGELVITRPMPSMPLFFWNDPDGSRYRESYFEMYPGVWRHGDWIKITERGSAVIYGRSDSTINRGGVRMGTSELYSAVESVPAVLDSLVVDVDDRIVLFVVCDGELDDALAEEIRRRVREYCSPRHVPDAIHRIDEVPRTLSNKKLEVPVKRILQGADPASAASRDSLANPAALDWFVAQAAELTAR